MSETAQTVPETAVAVISPAPKEQKYVAKVERGIGVKFANVAEMWALAKGFVDGGLAPKGGSIASVAASIIKGDAIGLDPVTSMACIQVVNGRASLMGDIALGLVRKSRLLAGYAEEERGKVEDQTFGVYITAKRSDTGETMTRSFTVEEAIVAGLWGTGQWAKWGKKRMLRYRALGFLLRDLFSDVLLGLYLSEEVDYEPQDHEPMTKAPTAPVPDPTVPDPAFETAVDAETFPQDAPSEAPPLPPDEQAVEVEPMPENGPEGQEGPAEARTMAVSVEEEDGTLRSLPVRAPSAIETLHASLVARGIKLPEQGALVPASQAQKKKRKV